MKGCNRRFPIERNLVLDICRAAKTVPCFPLEKTLQLKELSFVRSQGARRISWCAIFVKAWAKVSKEMGPLRDIYVSLPFRRIYRHPQSIANITIHRDDSPCPQGELIWCCIRAPEDMQLEEIQQRIDHSRTAPILEVFREGKLLARYPTLLRLGLWHILMRWWGRKKAKKLGTFSVSSLSGVQARNCLHPLVVTSSMEYGTVDPESGVCRFTLLCDHRVLDGMLAARALNRLETILQTDILQELMRMHSLQNQAA